MVGPPTSLNLILRPPGSILWPRPYNVAENICLPCDVSFSAKQNQILNLN